MWPSHPFRFVVAVLVVLSLAADQDFKGNLLDPGCNATLTAEGREGLLTLFLGRNVTMPTNAFFAYLRLNNGTADILRCRIIRTTSGIECEVTNPMYRSNGIINNTLSIHILNVTTETRGTYVWRMSVNDSWEPTILCNFKQHIKDKRNDKENSTVAAILVPVIILIIIIVIVIIVYLRKKRNANTTREISPEQGQPLTPNALPEDINNSPWFFENIDKEMSETLLLSHENEDGSYLIRMSEHSPDTYVLDVRYMDNITSHIIYHEGDNYFIVRERGRFNTLHGLINHYTQEQGCLPHHLFIPCKTNV